MTGSFECLRFQEFQDDSLGDAFKQWKALASDYGVNAELPFVDNVEFGELEDEAGAADEYIVSRLLLEGGDFVFKIFRGESGIIPGNTFDGAREEHFRDVFDCVGEVVHVFIAGGVLNDGGPEGFHKLIRRAAV